jgi:hypothetical protein
MSDGGGPDWKKAGDYPEGRELNDISLDRWAWEFLLRNPEFRKELTQAKSEMGKARPEDDKQKGPVGWSEKPTGRVLRKWGVEFPMLPEWRKGNLDRWVVFKNHPVHAVSVKLEGRRFQCMPESELRVVLEFDLAAPIAPQLKRAKAILDASKKRHKGKLPSESRKQIALYPLYLRVLDAKAAKATSAKMAEVFSSERAAGVSEKDIDNWLTAAERMANGGYKRLVTLSD